MAGMVRIVPVSTLDPARADLAGAMHSPHELRVEIALPHGKPQFLVAATNRGLEIRVFRPLESVLPWHSNPDATPT